MKKKKKKKKSFLQMGNLVPLITCMVLLWAHAGNATEWGCSASSGTFTQSTNCEMTSEVELNGDLSITGNENTYTTLIATSGERHFDIISGIPTLTLIWLNMTNGSPNGDDEGGYGGGSNPGADGGSIYIDDNVEGQLNITHCVFYKNYAGSGFSGGAIYANDNNVLISLTNTKFIKNSGGSGGAVNLYYGRLNSHNVQYIQNSAWHKGGGLSLYYVNPSTINNGLFTLNVVREIFN
jgi:predicted outer membrane repeat protein